MSNAASAMITRNSAGLDCSRIDTNPAYSLASRDMSSGELCKLKPLIFLAL